MSPALPARLGTTLLRWAPVDARRLLEIDCGDGALGEAYKRRNPAAFYAGVERAGAAAGAERRLDRVFEGDFEHLDSGSLLAEGAFDAVIVDGGLERLDDLKGSLERLKGLLAPGGHLIISVRNLGHWAPLSAILQGQAPFATESEPAGERLRHFTLPTLTEALEQAGLTTVKTRHAMRRDADKKGERLKAALTQWATALELDASGLEQRADATHYVIACRRTTEAPRRAAHLSLLAGAPSFLDVRTRLPADQLETLPGLSVNYGERTLSLPLGRATHPKILLQQRGSKTDEAAWMTHLADLIAREWVVITEFDDHPDLFRELGRGQAQSIELALSAAHAIQTSTPALEEAFRKTNPETRRFDNALFSLAPYRDRSSEPARVFYGALNRERFSAQIARALTPCVEANPDTEFVVVHDRAFFQALPTRSKRFLPAMPYGDYLRTMAQCHIALTPLEGTFGERFKSDIKFLEAAGAGVAMIASPPVYADTIVDGETGLIAPAVEDWPGALSRLLAEPKLRQELARNAWEYVRAERMFAYQAAARRDWYIDLWERRAELTDALVERHPMLKSHLASRSF